MANLQVIDIQLPSFFNNFDPRAAAANFPSSNWPFYFTLVSLVLIVCMILVV
jgi:hypothetical protein